MCDGIFVYSVGDGHVCRSAQVKGIHAGRPGLEHLNGLFGVHVFGDMRRHEDATHPARTHLSGYSACRVSAIRTKSRWRGNVYAKGRCQNDANLRRGTPCTQSGHDLENIGCNAFPGETIVHSNEHKERGCIGKVLLSENGPQHILGGPSHLAQRNIELSNEITGGVHRIRVSDDVQHCTSEYTKKSKPTRSGATVSIEA